VAVTVAGCAASASGSTGAADTSSAASQTSAGSLAPQGSTTTVTRTLTFTVVGDSITAGRVPNGASVPGSGSWVPTVGGAPLEFRPGWAVSGATTEDMRRGVTPTDADVVVIMGGTNDLQLLPWEVTAGDLRAIAATVDAGRVVLAAVPPNDPAPAAAEFMNDQLEALAREQGWKFFDPWWGISVEGRYLAGGSPDGVHPTVTVAELVGQRFREELLGLR
jgi:acyl-CoA thioesterase-1